MGRIVILVVLVALVAAVGCVTFGRSSGPAKCKSTTTVHLAGLILAEQTFRAETPNGHITVRGGDTAECSVTATITARAITRKAVDRLTAETKVEVAPSPDALTVTINSPRLRQYESVSVDLDIMAPKSTKLDLASRNGALTIDGITAPVTAKTHNGDVTCRAVSGSLSLTSQNGDVSVACQDNAPRDMSVTATSRNGEIVVSGATGNLKLETYNGAMNVSYAKTADPSPEATIVSRNGRIEITPPPGLDARVYLSTHNGSISTEIPLAVRGRLGRNVDATLGSGKGSLRIETYNGSVILREPGTAE